MISCRSPLAPEILAKHEDIEVKAIRLRLSIQFIKYMDTSMFRSFLKLI